MSTSIMSEPVQVTVESDFNAYLERTRDEPVYVILGVQGSGTNLLGRILVRIFNFSLLRDGSMVFNAAARLGNAPTRAAVEREIRRFKAIAFPSTLRRKTRRVLVDYHAFGGIVDELRPERIQTGADFARLIYAYRAFSLGTTRMAVKSDDLWQHLDAIDQVLPNRRIILITRDFRDNLLSVSGKNFGPIEPLRAARYVKKQFVKYAAEYRRTGDNAYHVTFETLLNSTRQFVDGIASHFQLPPAVDPDAAIRALQFRPNKTGKWKSLPPQELAWCEGMLHRELVEFGYAPESRSPQPPNQGVMIAATAKDTLKRVPQKIFRTIERLKS